MDNDSDNCDQPNLVAVTGNDVADSSDKESAWNDSDLECLEARDVEDSRLCPSPRQPSKSLRNPRNKDQNCKKNISDFFVEKKTKASKMQTSFPKGKIPVQKRKPSRQPPKNLLAQAGQHNECKRSKEHKITVEPPASLQPGEVKKNKKEQPEHSDGKSRTLKKFLRGKTSSLSHEQRKALGEEQRKQKYEDLKKAKAEKAAKRAERNTVLREHRRKKKEDEKRQQDENEKRMQELCANFLGEDAQLAESTETDSQADGVLETSHSQSSFSGFRKVSCYEMSQLDAMRRATAETLLEYRWPLDGNDAEYYFLQEQVCEYLGIKSFKRRYPDVARRNVEAEERDFLLEKKVVRHVQADLGLTALLSSQVLDIMSSDFRDKYEEYRITTEMKSRSLCQTNYNTVVVEKHKFADFVEKAIHSAASWNKRLNVEKREKRRAYFDMQTLCVHYPMNNRGRMKPKLGPRIGLYPIALIPGQFVDCFKTYSSKQLKYLPLSTASKAPPTNGTRLDDLDSEDEDCDASVFLSSDSESSTETEGRSSSSSLPSFRSSSESSDELVPTSDLDRAGHGEADGRASAKCKFCPGADGSNSRGQTETETLLRCANCHHSYHPGCVQLCQDTLSYVTSYGWECTECKVCVMCKIHADDDKLLFCDLCDRGYHIYCVGLTTVPTGRWHCRECAECVSCGLRDADDWVFEYKPAQGGVKIYSHTLCALCHRSWKRGQFCPECNVVFGKEKNSKVEYSSCWVCCRQHHLHCVAQQVFICASCQKKTLEKSLGAAQRHCLAKEKLEGAPPAQLERSAATTTLSLRRSQLLESGPVACDVCRKVYKNRSTLYSHKNRDHGLKASAQKDKC